MQLDKADKLIFKIHGKPKENLIGKTFTRLTVLKLLGRCESFKSRVLFYEVLCICGTRLVVSAQELKTGETTSCGCRRSEQLSSNLTGLKFGKLTVLHSIKRIEQNVSQNLYWVCKCDCGNTHTVSTNSLKNKCTTSCGCTLKEHQKTNFNTVLSNGIVGYIKPLKLLASGKIECICLGCNKIKIYRASLLLKKEIKSCGCKTKEMHSINGGGTGISGEVVTLTRLLREYISDKWSAKLRNQPCCISNMTENIVVHHLNAFHNIVSLFGIKTSKDYLALLEEDKNLLRNLLLDIQNGLPMTIEYHKLLHKELGKTPTKEESLNWINNKRKENGLHELQWSPLYNKYI